MTDKSGSSMGPQGTQVFDVKDVNKMLAEQSISSQSEDADTPVLIGISENTLGQQHLLDKDKIEVGRRPNSDIVLGEASVSSMHAQIIYDQGEWKVLNLLSSNGTFVNGEKISERAIEPGDRIAFAGSEFVFTMVDEGPRGKGGMGGLTIALVGFALVAAFAGLFYFIL